MPTNYVVKFGNKESDGNPYGIKGVFQIPNAKLANGKRVGGGLGDVGSMQLDSTYITVHNPNDGLPSDVDAKEARTLYAYVMNLLQTKMEPDTITVSELETGEDGKGAKIIGEVEHSKATISAMSTDSLDLVIHSEKATKSEIPPGGDSPTNKTTFNFTNNTINADS
ncbi:MAG: hypothetical protein AAGA27_03600 [Pseudomonadota bacterium]